MTISKCIASCPVRDILTNLSSKPKENGLLQNAQIHYFIKCLSKDHLTKHASDVLSCDLKLKFGLRSSFISYLHVFGIAILHLVTHPQLVYSIIAS